jgi:hypothetical protein
MTDILARVVQGDDVKLNFTIQDRTDTAVDITNSQAITFKVRKEVGATVTISKTLGSGIAITDGAAGQLTVTLESTDTEDMNIGGHVMELQITDENGDKNSVTDSNYRKGRLEILSDLD